jgi:hypothetical protein
MTPSTTNSSLVEHLKDEAVKIAMERSPGAVSSRDITGSVIWKAAERLEKIEAALQDFMDATAPAVIPADRDPVHGSRVEELGESIGYGALMTSASASWRRKLILAGTPTGGEFVVGPCMGTLMEVRRRARSAMLSTALDELEPAPSHNKEKGE